MISIFRVLFTILLFVEFSSASIPVEFEEKPLSYYSGEKGEAYRVAIEPFGNFPVLVRVVSDGKNYTLTAKQLSGVGLYYMGSLVATWEATIPANHWKIFQKHVQDASFWNKQGQVKEPPMLDGTLYYFEGYKNRKSLSLDRHCVGVLPEDKGLEKMAYYFLKFSREKAILERSPYYSSPIGTTNGKYILIGNSSDYRSKK